MEHQKPEHRNYACEQQTQVDTDCSEPLLTWEIQGMKDATLVNTLGFLGVLQPLPLTKLLTPWTYHFPSRPLQFRGPPESP